MVVLFLVVLDDVDAFLLEVFVPLTFDLVLFLTPAALNILSFKISSSLSSSLSSTFSSLSTISSASGITFSAFTFLLTVIGAMNDVGCDSLLYLYQMIVILLFINKF